MRRAHNTWLMALTLVLAMAPADALAKNKGKRGGKRGDPEIQLTGFKSFDKVFRKVDSIDERIDVAELAMKIARRDLNTTLGLKKGTPLKTALDELKLEGGDLIGMVMDGKRPTLTVTEAAPTNIVGAVEAVNGLTRSLITSVDQMAGIPQEVEGLADEIKAFPDRVKQEFQGDPIGATFKAPKLLKSIKGNLEITSSLPKRSVQVTDKATSILKVVGTEFTPLGDKQDARGGTARDGGGSSGSRTGGARRR